MTRDRAILQNLRTYDGQTQFVRTQKNELFCFSDDHYWRKVSVFTVFPGGVMIHFKHQVFYLTRR